MRGHGKLKPLDRYRRDSTLVQFTTHRLRDFIDPGHLLIRTNEQFDFAEINPKGRNVQHSSRNNGFKRPEYLEMAEVNALIAAAPKA